jgi:peptidyl-prolyl cis-trans isomerase SurA
MKKYLIIAAIFFAAYITAGVSYAQEVVADVAGDKITVTDFDREYLKASPDITSGTEISFDKKKEYLDLLINFRLKIKDAYDRGLQNSPDLEKEISDFKDNLLISFFTDKNVVEPYINKLYERKKYEVRVSHILISLTGKYTPEDSEKAYKKFYEIQSRLQNGEDFALLAKIYSDDPSAYQNGGDIYYFTGGQTVPEFEDVAYTLPVGSFSTEPVRTQFGLHIIKVTDRKERVEAVKMSHIFVRTNQDSTGKLADSLTALNKITEILNELKNGADFATLAKEKSEDPPSAENGGQLGFMQRRRLYLPLDSVLFTLKQGEISGIVQSPAGFHIMKADEVLAVKPLEKEYDEMKSEYKRGYIYKNELAKFTESILSKADFRFNESGIDFLKSRLDTIQVLNKMNLDSLLEDGKASVYLASYSGGNVDINDFISYIRNDREAGIVKATGENLTKFIKEASKPKVILLAAKESGLENDPQFVSLFNEFVNGLLIYKIDQQELYPKVKVTDDDILQYYEKNKEKYKETKDGKTEYKKAEDVRAEISNELQMMKYKEIEKEYIDKLKAKYPVTIYEENLNKTLQNLPEDESEDIED